MTTFLPNQWNARWIAPMEQTKRHPILFQDFSVDGPIQSAVLYITGYGLFEASLNGQKLGDEVFAPFFDDYGETTQVLTFDLRNLLQQENHLEILLGNGWYKGRFGFVPRENRYGDGFAAIAQLEIVYADGSAETVCTDETWQCRFSEIMDSGFYDGEHQDYTAPEETCGVKCLPIGTAHLISRDSQPLCVQERLPVREILHTPAGETVLDFGQNFAGWVEFTSQQPQGNTVTLEFGEVLEKGNFYNGNLGTADCRFTVVSDGKMRTYHPHFTYFGFRYVRVSGWQGELNQEDFSGCVISSKLGRTGWFQSGNKDVNRLYENIRWGQKANFVDVPTDCPQRAERLLWTADAQVFAPTACFNMDCREFYPHFLRLLRQDQRKRNGGIANYLPADPVFPDPCPVWGDCAVILPYTLYEFYGDSAILEKHYPMMRDWLNYLEQQDQENGGHWLCNYGFQFGDWLALDGITENSYKGGTEDALVSTLYWYNSVQLMIRTAEILKKEDDLAHYMSVEKAIRNAVLDEYFTPSGRLAIDTQTAYLLCLRFELYPNRERIIEGLKTRLAKDCYRITSGFAAAPLICSVLTENGFEKEAMRMLLREDFPGWLYQVSMGATTVWERWNSMLPDGTINPSGMNSFNHYAYGSVGQFLYENIAGLKGTAPGFRSIRFAPLIDARLGWCSAAYDSVSGHWESEWRIHEDGSVSIRLVVPENCTAKVVLPYCEKAPFTASAGELRMTYQPTADLLHPYGSNSLVEELLRDDAVKEMLEHYISHVVARATGGDREIAAAEIGRLPFPPYLLQDAENNKRLIEKLRAISVMIPQ